MSASLTPLRRFVPLRHMLRAEEACDAPIPLPPPTINTPWPPRRGGAAFSIPSLDHLEAAVAAMDAGDSGQQAPGTMLEQARSEGYDAGVRDAIVSRSWWDVVSGLTWGAALIALLIGALAVAGWVDVKVRVWGDDTAGTPEPVQVHPTTHWSTQA